MSDTVCSKLLETAKKLGEKTAIQYKRGGRWSELDWNGYLETIESIAAGLQVLGVRKGDRVAILASTRYEWAASDLAVLGLGALTVPIYPNSANDEIAFILSDSAAKVLICDSASLVNKIRPLIRAQKTIEHVIVFDSESTEGAPNNLMTVGAGAGAESQPAMSLQEVRKRGETALQHSPALYQAAVSELKSTDSASIIYTSGTTGRPRGVLHLHSSLLSEVIDAFPLLGVTARDQSISFLPYAHVLGRIEIYGHVLTGYKLAFAQSIERLREDLVEIKPTIMLAVPRIFEKIHTSIMAQAEISPIGARVFKWAIDVGREVSRCKTSQQPVPIELALKYQLARRTVFLPILRKLGGNMRFAVCGGAPLSSEIAEFFHSTGLLILEGYGLTETFAAITVNTPFDYRFGTVGKAIGDVRLKLGSDGEVFVQSKKVAKEYYKDPQETALAFKDGWFATGDIGEISQEGYLKITDRKKNLIKTAGGKYVAPMRLENFLKASRFISQVYIHGDHRKFVTALITLDLDVVGAYARENKIPFGRPEDLAVNPKIKSLIHKAVADANQNLASWESIKSFAILPREFTIEAGELTPSLKIKRSVVDLKYADVIERLYGGVDAGAATH